MSRKGEDFSLLIFSWLILAFFMGVWFVVWKVLDLFFKQEDKDVNAS